ncbi:6459_t:CDS:2, partial [Funneliformis geosporum]
LGDLSINEWDVIIVQVKSLFHIEFTACLFVAILDEINTIMHQMSSDTNARESENAIRDVLRSARHVLAIDAFTNKSTLAFLKVYHGEDIHIINNRHQPHVNEMVEILYDLNSEAKVIRIGYDLLRQGKLVIFIFTRAVMARALVEKASKLSKPDNLPVRALEAGISFEITGYFDIVIAITNIATLVHVEALTQMLY